MVNDIYSAFITEKKRRFRSNLYVFDSLKALTDDGAVLNGNKKLNEN